MLWLLLSLGTALAHHDTGVGQVGAAGPPVAQNIDESSSRIRLGLAADARWFGRTLSGTRRTTSGAGSVGAMWLLPSATVRLGRSANVSVVVPVGTVVTRAPSDNTTAVSGLGDVNLRAAARRDKNRLALTAAVNISAPTGAYTSDAAWTLTDAGIDDTTGAWTVTSWDTRASLGAGVWRAGIEALGSIRLGPGEIIGTGRVQQPLTSTPDQIRWGRDVGVGLGWRHELQDTALQGMVTGSHHADDAVQQTEDGKNTVASMGERQAVSARLQLERTLASTWSWGAQVGVPVWQRTEGTQLVESGSLTVWLQRDLL